MAAANPFPAGLALDAHKAVALRRPLLPLPPPSVALLALDQGSGALLEPVVRPGDRVDLGTVVARPVDDYAATLHSPVSGRVLAIEPRDAMTPSHTVTCIVVENDGEDRVDRGCTPPGDMENAVADQLVAAIRAAGIAGLGGAAFPTASKLALARQRGARLLLLNGAECEPWICCDDALLREFAGDIVHGASVLMRALEAERCIVLIEDDKPEAIAALEQAIRARADDPRIEVRSVPAVYPQGAERQLVTAATGLEVPAGGWPADVGVTCQNVATAAAVAHWATQGLPCVSRAVTVTGSGVAEPRNVLARIGTPLATLVEAAGGYVDTPLRLIAGGSMTGRTLASDDVGLTKAMNCVLAATAADLQSRLDAREVPCIRCGDCARVCPAGLLPQQLHRSALAEDEAGLLAHGLWDCIDCGCCDYVCPSQIPLAHRFRVARRAQAATADSRRRASEARERFERRTRRLHAAAESERQAFDAARARARTVSSPNAPSSPSDDAAT